MKRMIGALLLCLLLALSFAEGLSDIGSHWGKPYISALVGKNCISGYPDGTFKPDGTIKIGEFVKILVGALGHTGIGNHSGGHWAENYIQKAVELKLITASEHSGDCSNYDQKITRGQMARMIARTMTETFTDTAAYSAQITDLGKVPGDQKDAVAKMYRAGIITGYPDGSFKAGNTATRAEASTMLMRYLDKSLRQVPELGSAIWTDAQFEAFVNKNPEAVKYCSTRFFYIKDKQLVFKKGMAGLTSDTIPPEKNFPGVNALIYRAAKQLVWDAYQNGDYAVVAYASVLGANSVDMYYYESQLMGEAMVHQGNFMVDIRLDPTDPAKWPEMSGMTKKVKMYWLLRVFNGDKDFEKYGKQYVEDRMGLLDHYIVPLKNLIRAVCRVSDDQIYDYFISQYISKPDEASLKTISNVEIKTLKDEGFVFQCYTGF